jgi:hypothetical protein
MRHSHYALACMLSLTVVCFPGYASEPEARPPWQGQYKIKPRNAHFLHIGAAGVLLCHLLTRPLAPTALGERVSRLEAEDGAWKCPQ